MAFTSDILRFEDSIANRIQRGIDALKQQQQRRAVYRQTFDELSILTDRDLNDLGIARTDIRRLALEAKQAA